MKQPLRSDSNSVSCRTFLVRGIAVELAEQGIAVFLGPVGQVSDEGLDLFPGGFAEALGAAEIDRVRLDQVGIELVSSQFARPTEQHGRPGVLLFPAIEVARQRSALFREG